MERNSTSHLVNDSASYKARSTHGPFKAFLVSIRIDQWTKNFILFAALVFGGQLLSTAALVQSCVAFLVFCFLSSAMYLLNDVVDQTEDRRHPIKRLRPIAAGTLSPTLAILSAALLGVAGITIGFFLNTSFGIVATAFLGLLILYNHWLKFIIIIDVIAIGVGFVLRAMAGALAIDVPISQWLLMCTILLALFLGCAKRRHELTTLGDEAFLHRKTLSEYRPEFLDQLLSILAGSTIVTYIFYTIDSTTIKNIGTDWITITLLFPIYGIFRYMHLIRRENSKGNPSDILLSDRPLLTCIVLWVVTVTIIIYHPFLL